MKGRGRPLKITGERRYPNRLRELRGRLGLSQQNVAAAAGISLAYYGALERGDKRINADIAQRLQGPLRCSAGDLLAGTTASSVPLRYAIAAAEAETRPASFELPEPSEWLPAGRFSDPQHCFAAEIVDDSADLDFARGTILFVRTCETAGEALRIGAKIVVRFLLDEAAGGNRQTHEILYGVLDQNIVGDLVLVTRSRNRLVPRHALIQTAPALRVGLAEAPRDLRREGGGAVDYRPRPEDRAQILGVVVYAAGPT